MTVTLTRLSGLGQCPPAPVTKTYRTTVVDTVDRTTYTFTGIAVSATDTYVIFCVFHKSAAANGPASFTLTGNVSGAQTVRNLTGANNTVGVSFSACKIENDTSVDISVTYSGGCTACAIALWSGENSLAYVAGSTTIVGSDTSHSYSANVGGSIHEGWAVFAGVINSNTTSPSITMGGGITEDAETALEGGIKIAVGSALGPLASNPTASYSANTDPGSFQALGIGPAGNQSD